MSRFTITAQVSKTWYKLPEYVLGDGRFAFNEDSYPRAAGGVIQSAGGRFVSYRLPAQILAPLLAVDLSNESAILDFVRRFGVLGVTESELQDGRIADFSYDPSEIAANPSLGIGAGSYVQQVYDFRVATALLRRAQGIAVELSAPGGPNRYRLADLDDCYGFYDKPPSGVSAARFQFDRIVNTGLSAFGIRSKTVAKKHVLVSEPLSLSLFAIACMELANAFDRGLPWRNCALESCHQLFQPGRVDQIYHDAACGRVQASREYRKRQRRKGR